MWQDLLELEDRLRCGVPKVEGGGCEGEGEGGVAGRRGGLLPLQGLYCRVPEMVPLQRECLFVFAMVPVQ